MQLWTETIKIVRDIEEDKYRICEMNCLLWSKHRCSTLSLVENISGTPELYAELYGCRVVIQPFFARKAIFLETIENTY